jgi:hypothetical protein
MFRRSLGAALVLLAVGSFVLAETYQGLITKLDKDSVTIKTRGKKKGEKGKEMTFKVNNKTKLQKAGKKGDEPTTISASDLKDLIKKGVKRKDKTIEGAPGKIETTGEGDKETATTITVGGGKRAKKKKTDE